MKAIDLLKRVTAAVWLLASIPLCAQQRDMGMARTADGLAEKNFHLLRLLRELPEVDSLVRSEEKLQDILKCSIERISDVFSAGFEVNRFCESFLPDTSQAIEAGDVLVKMVKDYPGAMRRLTENMRGSKHYVRYVDYDDHDLLRQAWKDVSDGLRQIVNVYGKGSRPRYPNIDSINYDVASPAYRNLLIACGDAALSNQSGRFYDLSLAFAMNLMEANGRDEAIRFEPLKKDENKLAVERADYVDWSDFPYAAILVPGAGNAIPHQPLSAWGKMRLKLAGVRYRNGQAPYIIVSGGYVHPFQTPYNEAREMKAYLMNDMGIPEEAIIIEPYARHTTTNLRNSGRLAIRYALPLEKPILIVTDRNQSQYIESSRFLKRCESELGYLPFLSLNRVDDHSLAFIVHPYVTHLDNADPLDP